MGPSLSISELRRLENILMRGHAQRDDAARCAQLVASLRASACNVDQFRRLDHQVRNKVQQLIVRFGNARFLPDEQPPDDATSERSTEEDSP
jgi:hypothetical protein